jgi:hypothetical protein
MRGVILSGVLAVASMAAMAETEPLTVLQVLDLSGQNGDTGKDFVAGAKVYFDYINSRGGINGRKIRHVLADDQGQPQHTLKLTRQALQDEKPVALFGYLGADNLATVLDDPQLRQRGLPMVGPYSGMAGRQWPNLFPVKAAYADEVRKISAYDQQPRHQPHWRVLWQRYTGQGRQQQCGTRVGKQAFAGRSPGSVFSQPQHRTGSTDHGTATAAGGDSGRANHGQRAVCT